MSNIQLTKDEELTEQLMSLARQIESVRDKLCARGVLLEDECDHINTTMSIFKKYHEAGIWVVRPV